MYYRERIRIVGFILTFPIGIMTFSTETFFIQLYFTWYVYKRDEHEILKKNKVKSCHSHVDAGSN